MIGTKTAYEDMHGATPDYGEVSECAECGVGMNPDDDYFVTSKRTDKSYCRDCVRDWGERGDVDKILAFLGYKDAFEMVFDVNV